MMMATWRGGGSAAPAGDVVSVVSKVQTHRLDFESPQGRIRVDGDEQHRSKVQRRTTMVGD